MIDRFNIPGGLYIQAVNANDEDMFAFGLATGGGNDFLDDGGATWEINQFQGAYIWINEGLGVGQIKPIASNTATRIIVTGNWAVNPNNTSRYNIGGGVTLSGTGAYHFQIPGGRPRVYIYGFRHIGATTYDIHHGAGYLEPRCNYHMTSVKGI